MFASGSLPQFWQNEKITSPAENVPNLLGIEQKAEVNTQEKNRISYVTCEKEFDVTSLIDFIQSKKGPRLVVLNTVQSAAVLAWKMRKSGKQVMHLSTALTPNDRDALVEDVKIGCKSRRTQIDACRNKLHRGRNGFLFCNGIPREL